MSGESQAKKVEGTVIGGKVFAGRKKGEGGAPPRGGEGGGASIKGEEIKREKERERERENEGLGIRGGV